ncbi:gamma carbonic anhydrase family protein [Pleionea mediterranea]|uniref:Carbonic anhydrase/acetyltransferase-like protein (Isoleucine patch superfamily) n=1 Tax=Pleionea mediterranea TaxID=523701 RepID=A0A316FZ39_9GAMM|nr:gamma carbonic anhydrase family protein [Pleionea mediterranea]PWK52810.1 carbonic anhydrase/acetyltransferase-like protein (isoleucine patch superfamily) [Pleionea mediterranea]
MNIRSFENYTPELGKRVFVDPTALVVGQVSIGDDSSIWPMAVLRGDVHAIEIGARSSIQDGAVCHVTHASHYNPDGHRLIIGDDVTVGHKAMLHGCKINNEVLIGMGSVVMDDVVIHSNVVLGANSVVPPGRELEGGFLWVGSPARKIRTLTDDEIAFFKYSADNYVKLKDRYLNGQ